MSRFAFIAAFGIALLVGSSQLGTAMQPDKLNADTALLVKGDNAFAFDLYQNLSKEDGNLFFSPYSISNALAMTYAGARGQTALDMAKTLQFPFDGPRLNPAFNDLIQELNRRGQKRDYQLSIANRLWGQKDYGFQPEFLQISKESYGAGLEEVDFARATEKARLTINDWVAKETQDKIKDLIPGGVLKEDTRLVLTNAIYFKAQWAYAFDTNATKMEDFRAAAGKTVKVDMMHTSVFMNLFESDALQLLEMPYKQQELSMLVFLPRKIDGVTELEKQLSTGNVDQWLGKAKTHQVALSLPKYKYTSQFMLKDVLSKMGMGLAFSPSADFSGMATREKLRIDAVIHKAFVAVDEKGTEAAAATAVVIKPSSLQSAPPGTFRADHPFVFLIRDNRTGSILFMGRVVNL
jgi:serine protease inhibitor